MAHASIAERFAFGTPAETDAEPHVRLVPRDTTILVARILMAAIFLVSGIAKLADPAGAVQHMQGVGIPAPGVLVYIAGLAELFGGLSLLGGFLTRIGGIGLFVYLVITTLTFHAFWNYEGAQRLQQNVQFMKNLAILGGLLLVWAVGPGRYSVDAKLRKPRSP